MAPFENHQLKLTPWIGFTRTLGSSGSTHPCRRRHCGDRSCTLCEQDASEGSLPLARRNAVAPYLWHRVGLSLGSGSTATATRGYHGVWCSSDLLYHRRSSAPQALSPSRIQVMSQSSFVRVSSAMASRASGASGMGSYAERTTRGGTMRGHVLLTSFSGFSM